MKLVIAEKPSVASAIAGVVGASKREKGYISGNDYIVSWCVGHLVELADPDAYNPDYRKWSLETLPIIPEEYQTKVSEHTAEQFKILQDLMNRSDIDELIEATDAGREGELIFRLVYQKAQCKKPFKRLWINSNEEKVIHDGLANMKDGKEYDNLYYAAVCRQRADWLVGINLSRLYSVMYNKKLSTGRVQTPTTNLIVQRQREIDNFIPQTYYSLVADLGNFKAYNRTEDKTLADQIVEHCRGKIATVIQVEKQDKTENPIPLYDLTTLQRDANRMLGYSAQQTLEYMQKLYDEKLATYPRTDSRYITADMEQSTRKLIENLLSSSVYNTTITNDYDCNSICMKRIINDKKVTDHHAILPTENITKEKLDALPTGEKNIMTMILHRLISSVYNAHKYTTTKASLDIESYVFIATGKEILDLGYRMVEEQLKSVIKAELENNEKDNSDSALLPAMQEGSTFDVQAIKTLEKKTTPPKAYTDDTLLDAMQTAGKNIEDPELKEAMKDSGLGTTATRAGIIENIIKIGYIRREGKKLLPTETAYTFIDLVHEQVKEPEMTAQWEKQLSAIYKGELSADDFMNGITEFISSFVKDTKLNYSPEQSTGVFDREIESIGVCPKCQQKIIEKTGSFSCQSNTWKKNNNKWVLSAGCGFEIRKKIAGKAITKTQAQKLLKKGKTDMIKGFTSAKTGKPFDAYLILKSDNTIGFEFPQKN